MEIEKWIVETLKECNMTDTEKELVTAYANATQDDVATKEIIKSVLSNGLTKGLEEAIDFVIDNYPSEKACKNRLRNLQTDEEINSLMEDLKEGVKELMETDNYKRYLNLQSHYHDYSVRNCLLIYLQSPEATMVGSYSFWKSIGRYVKKGEKGIKILAPVTIKKTVDVPKLDEHKRFILGADGKPETDRVTKEYVSGFKLTTTFDVTQTDGKPIPQVLKTLTGNNEVSGKLIETITNIFKHDISYKDLNGPHGAYYPETKNIALQRGMSQDQTAKTLIHEFTHSILHEKVKDYASKRSNYEIEAESAAYIVSKHFGLDTSEYSFGYISHWTKGLSIHEFEDSLKLVSSTAKVIINDIQKELDREYEQMITNKKNDIVAYLKGFGVKPDYKTVNICLSLDDNLLKEIFANPQKVMDLQDLPEDTRKLLHTVATMCSAEPER